MECSGEREKEDRDGDERETGNREGLGERDKRGETEGGEESREKGGVSRVRLVLNSSLACKSLFSAPRSVGLATYMDGFATIGELSRGSTMGQVVEGLAEPSPNENLPQTLGMRLLAWGVGICGSWARSGRRRDFSSWDR